MTIDDLHGRFEIVFKSKTTAVVGERQAMKHQAGRHVYAGVAGVLVAFALPCFFLSQVNPTTNSVSLVNRTVNSTNKQDELSSEPSSDLTISSFDEAKRLCAKDSTFANEWCHPAGQEFCYQQPNNWSGCVRDHLLYPPTSNAQLYSRKVMCLFEPLCWLQLDDWRTTDPPAFKECPIDDNTHLNMYDWSLHDGTMASMYTILSESLRPMIQANNKSTLDLYSCNSKNSAQATRNYHYNFKLCAADYPHHFVSAWTQKANDDIAKDYYTWTKNTSEGQATHAHITSFVPQFFEFLMGMNRTVILNFLHRANVYRCTTEESANTFANIIRLASSGPTGEFSGGPLHIVAPGYVHDVEYIRHYTNVRPLYLPFSLLNILPKEPYTGDHKDVFLWNAHKPVPSILSNSSFTMKTPHAYELVDLLKYRAAIVLPYSITNTKSLEQYELNIPIFVPTPEFAIELELFDDRTATYTPYCSLAFPDAKHPHGHPKSPYEYSPNARAKFDGKKEDELFWISFSEVYVWPCIRKFKSWEDLLEQLQSATDESYQETSLCMKQANKWRKYEVDTNTCWMLQRIQPERRELLLSYEETLQALYNVSSIRG